MSMDFYQAETSAHTNDQNIMKNVLCAWSQANARKRMRIYTGERNKIQILIEFAND